MPSVPSPSMFRGFVLGKKSSAVSLNAAEEPQHLEEAMRAAAMILNDDLDGAERGVRDGASSFHHLGRGMVSFMRATLGFEADMMREASEQLAEAETRALEDQRRAQRDHFTKAGTRSTMYPPGSEYALCAANAQLMSAVVAVMSESLTEGIRGFYKLRKAYVALDAIVDAEGRYVESNPSSATPSPRVTPSPLKRNSRSREHSPARSATFPLSAKSKLSHVENGADSASDNEDDDFQDAEESQDVGKLSSYVGHLDMNGSAHTNSHNSSHTPSPQPSTDSPLPPFSASQPRPDLERLLSHDPSSALFAHPTDVFVHAGTNLCYGLLLTMLSLVPPAFGRLLAVVGFRGDRARGLRMMWQAAKFQSVYGAMAGLCLFGFYNGLVSACDILPDMAPVGDEDDGPWTATITGYPTQRLDALLVNMRARYPQSKLWRLEEARMRAARRDLPGGLALLAGDIASPLKQVHALAVFERGLQAMFAYDLALTSESFQACMKLNNWSWALYLFIAGSAQLELYRRAKTAGPAAETDAAAHAAKATELLQSARAHAGKKKFMARQLPLDAYVLHCLAKWDATAKALRIPFVDAVGASPLEVMVWMWSGHKKMAEPHLRAALAALEYAPASPAIADAVDERAVRAVLRAAALRSLGSTAEAKAMLREDVLGLDRVALRGELKDNWPQPVAHYELAAALWAERGVLAAERKGRGEPVVEEKRLVREAEEELNKAAKWDRYMLDARVGVRVTTALDTVHRWRVEHDPS